MFIQSSCCFCRLDYLCTKIQLRKLILPIQPIRLKSILFGAFFFPPLGIFGIISASCQFEYSLKRGFDFSLQLETSQAKQMDTKEKFLPYIDESKKACINLPQLFSIAYQLAQVYNSQAYYKQVCPAVNVLYTPNQIKPLDVTINISVLPRSESGSTADALS